MTALPEDGRSGAPAPGPRVVDAQVHIWGEDTAARPWPPGGARYAHRDRALGAGELLAAMDGAGIDRAVLVPPSWEGDRNDLVEKAARDHPDRFAWAGRVSLEPSAGRAALAAIREAPGALGVRLTFTPQRSAAALTDGTADWLWPELEASATPVMIFAPGQHAALAGIARAHPGLRLVIDHVGLDVEVRDVPLLPLFEPLFEMAALPNVAVKATALPCAVSEPYPFPSLHEPLRRLIEAFGADRVFWGTDLTRLPCTYAEARSFVDELAFPTPEGREWFLGRGIEEWLGWRPLKPAGSAHKEGAKS